MSSFVGSILGVGGSSASGAIVYHNQIQVLIGASQSSMHDISSIMPPMNKLVLHYQDPISFQADTLDLTFEDIGDKILKSSNIKKGMWLKVKILQYNREYVGSLVTRDLGSFMIDQIKTAWPYSQTTLMGSSVPISEQIKLTLQNKTRYVGSIKELAQQVATENGLGFEWDAPENRNRVLSEAQQWNESDLQMLSKVCRSNALSFKIKDINGVQTLVVFDEQDLENKPPVYTIDFSKPGAGIKLVHGELTTQSQDIYSTSALSYFDPYTNTVYAALGQASDDTGSGEQVRSWDQKNSPKDGAGAIMAKDGTGGGGTTNEIPDLAGTDSNVQTSLADDAALILRAKNTKEYHSILTTAGTLVFPQSVAIESGVVATFKNKGLFDGNWIVQKVTITTSEAKLVSEIEWRKCMIPVKGTTVQPVSWTPIGGIPDTENE